MTLNDQNLNDVIRPIVERALSRQGLNKVEVASKLDHDGDPIVEVLAYLPASLARLNPERTFEITQNIIGELRSRGDERFPHVLMLYAEDGSDEDYDHTPRSGGRVQ